MICLDASIVGMLICPDEGSPTILKEYKKSSLEGKRFIAPTLLPYEFSSILRKKQIRKLLTHQEVLGAIHFFEGLEIEYLSYKNLFKRCLSLCDIFGKDLTIYDASYLAIAEEYHAELWTADKILFETASISFTNLRFLP